MSKIGVKSSDPNVLTEREKQILAYRREGHSFRETCKALRVSPNEISTAEKKEKGEYVPKEKVNPNSQNYSEMYGFFSRGKQPLQVAIALNLPVDYVSEQYTEYLKSKRFYSLVQLYQDIGDEGTRGILLAYYSMAQCGYSNDPKSVGRFVKYCQEVHGEDMNLQKTMESSSKANQDVLAKRSELRELSEQIQKARKILDDTNKASEESKKELARINDAIVCQLRANPTITAAQAGREAAESVLKDDVWLIRTAQEVYLNAIQNNIYVRWLYIPETRPEVFDRFSEKQIVAYCQAAIDRAANEYFNRVLNEALRRASGHATVWDSMEQSITMLR